jgi:hypothetical protein
MLVVLVVRQTEHAGQYARLHVRRIENARKRDESVAGRAAHLKSWVNEQLGEQRHDLQANVIVAETRLGVGIERLAGNATTCGRRGRCQGIVTLAQKRTQKRQLVGERLPNYKLRIAENQRQQWQREAARFGNARAAAAFGQLLDVHETAKHKATRPKLKQKIHESK